MTRFVFDTNVLVSAALWDTSTPGQAVARGLDQGRMLISAALISELSQVLSRDKFNRYLTPEERERFLITLIAEAELVEITESIQACRDPKDDQILELAVSGNASLIVTGDQDLLTLNPFRGISIVTPAEMLKASP